MTMELLTDRARKAVHIAKAEAGLRPPGTAHILFGLCEIYEGVAGHALSLCNIVPHQIQRALDRTKPWGVNEDADVVKQTVKKAESIANKIGDKYVGTEHLLLAILDMHGSALLVLHELNVFPNEIVVKVHSLIGNGVPDNLISVEQLAIELDPTVSFVIYL